MAALPRTLFLLGVASLAFDLASVLVKAPFARSGLTLGDAIEAIGVFVVCLLYLRVGSEGGGVHGRRGTLLVLAALAFAFGRGIHVAANSLHDLLDRSGVGDPTGLATFWDEHAGHYVADAARVGFALLLSARSFASPVAATSAPRGSLLILAGGVAYGFITFADSVEGRTVPLVLPFYLVYAVASALLLRRPGSEGRTHATRRFFAIAAVTALLFFAVWGIWQRGFPEFTAAGLLPSAGTHAAPDR